MSEVSPVPEHLHAVTPRLVVRDTQAAIDCYRRAFGAEVVEEPFVLPDGSVVHAEVRIGDSVVALTDEGVDGVGASPVSTGGRVTAMMSMYVPDVDSAWERALEAGFEVIYPLEDQFYGDRGGRLRDPFGQQWMLASRLEDLSREEIARRTQEWGGEGGG